MNKARRSIFVFLLTFLLLFSLRSGELWASLSISPAYVELTLDKGRPAGQFSITNLGDGEERYRIRAMHFTFSTDGGLREIPPDENSLVSWIKFNPKEFTLPPKTKQTIRFVVTPHGKLRPGEYWAAMELESLKTTFAKGKDGGGRELSIEVVPSILVPIFGKSGRVIYRAALKEARVTKSDKGSAIATLFANTGDGRVFVTGQYEIVDATGKVVEEGPLGKAYVLPRAERRFTTPVKGGFPAGNYTVRVHYTSQQLQEPISEEIRHSGKL